ncbi:MAG: M15 family metallopeptidase [Clostridia bacterium]|nr:M15 family metallopeptidase [Clostridia bacterium]
MPGREVQKMLKTRSLDCLMPYVRHLALRLREECAKVGIPLGFANTLRDKEYQEWCKKNGKSATAELGPHAFGLAFDVFINRKGSEYDMELLRRVGAIGKELGLSWAGDWKSFREYVHFEYTGGLTAADLRAGKRAELPAVPEELPAAVPMCIRHPGGELTGYAVDGVTYVPLRSLCEALGFSVLWDAARPNEAEVKPACTP